MPTPIRVFAEIAATYGDVNPDDADAVQKWFIETLPSLKPEQIDEILEALFRQHPESRKIRGAYLVAEKNLKRAETQNDLR